MKVILTAISALVLLFCAHLILTNLATNPDLIVLDLWEEEKPENQVLLDSFISEFEKENPGTKIKRSHYKTEDLRTQFQTGSLAGAGADIIIAPNDFAGVFSIMRVIKQVNEWGQLERFHEVLVNAITDPDGRSWGIPINRGNHLLLFVNKKLSKSPATIEELIQYATKAKASHKQVLAGLAYNQNEPFWFAPFTSLWNQRVLVNGRPQLANQAMQNALQLVHDFKYKYNIIPGSCGYTCAETLFLEEKAAMTINGDWAVDQYSKVLGDNLAILPLPKLAATNHYAEPMVSGKYLMFHYLLEGERYEVAKKFAEFIVSLETQMRIANESKRLPSLRHPQLQQLVNTDPILRASGAATEHGQPMPLDVEMRAVWDAIRPQLQAVMSDFTTPAKAIEEMQKDADTKLKDMRI